ncbi:MAG: cupin domain-containing protein [Actinomycetota bacterium]|nr:cupin domain-containing protein [Actinomycetota bacterium]
MTANVFQPEFDDQDASASSLSGDRSGFTWRTAKIGVQAGSERLGASLYELPPGQAICPYHAHLANEEMLIVLAGSPSLRTPAGWRRLEPGEVVSFPTGADGAHQVANFSDSDTRVLMLSEMIGPEVAIYPDSCKVMVREQPPGRPPMGYRKLFREVDEVGYWDGEGPPEPEGG